MRYPDKNGDMLVFVSELLSVIIHVEGDVLSDEARFSSRVEDSEGKDISNIARLHSVNDNESGNRWVDIYCPSLQIVGPFSAYPRLEASRPLNQSAFN